MKIKKAQRTLFTALKNLQDGKISVDEAKEISAHVHADVKAAEWELTKAMVCDALAGFIRQRPGFETNLYDPRTYRQESREASRDRRDAERLLSSVRTWHLIGAKELAEASRDAFGGRLAITLPGEVPKYSPHVGPAKGVHIEYCAGQYEPTERRAAACSVLARALWEAVREHEMPKPFKVYGSEDNWYALRGKDNLIKPVSAGTWLRNKFRNWFGSQIQKRWFE